MDLSFTLFGLRDARVCFCREEGESTTGTDCQETMTPQLSVYVSATWSEHGPINSKKNPSKN
jgi:hypothetical protein